MKQVIRSAARDDIIRQFRFYLVEQDVPEVAEALKISIIWSVRVIRLLHGGRHQSNP